MQLSLFNHEISISSYLVYDLMKFYSDLEKDVITLNKLDITFEEAEERPFVDRITLESGLNEPQNRLYFRKTYTRHLSL